VVDPPVGAFNQCLRIVKTALSARRADPDIDVPWTGFDRRSAPVTGIAAAR
jgi:hypothetical protein